MGGLYYYVFTDPGRRVITLRIRLRVALRDINRLCNLGAEGSLHVNTKGLLPWGLVRPFLYGEVFWGMTVTRPFVTGTITVSCPGRVINGL